MSTLNVQTFDILKNKDTRLSRLRRRLGLTQAEMAKRFRISRTYYIDLEAERKIPSETLMEMARLIEKEADFDERQKVVSDDISKDQGEGSTSYKAVADELDLVLAEAQRRFGNDPKKNPVLAEVVQRMQQWIEASSEDPAKAGYVLNMMKKYLPEEDLKL